MLEYCICYRRLQQRSDEQNHEKVIPEPVVWAVNAESLCISISNSEIMGLNTTQGRTQGSALNNIARASVNAESLCIPISQIQ